MLALASVHRKDEMMVTTEHERAALCALADLMIDTGGNKAEVARHGTAVLLLSSLYVIWDLCPAHSALAGDHLKLLRLMVADHLWIPMDASSLADW